MQYIYLSISWLLYYALHSLLASDQVKQRISRLLTNQNQWRIFYSVFSTIGLLGLLFQMAATPDKTLWQQHTIIKLISMICITYGLIIIKQSFKNQSIFKFLTTEDRFINDDYLKISGVYSKVRHPLYSGTILIFIGLFLFIPKISTIIALTATLLYLIIGIPLEERKLILKYGDKYLEYKKKVPSIIPKLF